ncbi:hypothetical protein [Rhodopseudomonas sp. BAL398]|uniref:hypothetical protein n=1 Tax=Rhodopseudomonas sp. BAL398 TaxID=3034676 RepID=UPI0023E1DAEE|nr:hypothetical protein [Rhodopseudomonas sp. BAL398]MDF3809586.1 hypothetical protein [Rhodopseudomonas sp. BAL398]
MTKTLLIASALFAALSVASSDPAPAQFRGGGNGSGPVGQMCARDINIHCAGLRHGNRGVRNCLVSHRSSLSRSCRAALDGTGGGRGMGRMGGGMGMGRYR